MVVQQQPYVVPLVLQNHSPAESMMQLLDSLEYFASTVDDAFSKLSGNLKQKKSELENLNRRLQAVQQKTQRVRDNTSKATTIYSLNKLPVTEKAEDKTPLIKQFDSVPIKRVPYNLTKEARLESCEVVNTVEVYNAIIGKQERQLQLGQEREGLGGLPNYIDSVNSCLLFNTSENPYQKYDTVLDALEGKEGKDREVKEDKIHDAPITLMDGEGLPSYMATDFNFRPEMKNLPTFDLPTSLPGIGGAADISWSTDVALPTIAPSATMSNLPTFDVMGKRTKAIMPSQPAMVAPPAPSAPSAPAPQAPAAPKASAPPPAPSKAAPPAPAQARKPVAKAAPAPAAGGGRNALLDAIRKGGGLKKGGGNSKRKKKREKTPEPVKGDIMSALKERLKRMQKAKVTGEDENESSPKKKKVRVRQREPPPRTVTAADRLDEMMKKMRSAVDADEEEEGSGDWSDE